MEAVIGLVVIVAGVIAAALGIQHKSGKAKASHDHIKEQVDEAHIAMRAKDVVRRDRAERERLYDKYSRD